MLLCWGLMGNMTAHDDRVIFFPTGGNFNGFQVAFEMLALTLGPG